MTKEDRQYYNSLPKSEQKKICKQAGKKYKWIGGKCVCVRIGCVF